MKTVGESKVFVNSQDAETCCWLTYVHFWTVGLKRMTYVRVLQAVKRYRPLGHYESHSYVFNTIISHGYFEINIVIPKWNNCENNQQDALYRLIYYSK